MFNINNNREIQNKNYEISPHTHRIATIKYNNNKKETKIENSKCWWGCRESGIFGVGLWGVQPLKEIVSFFPQIKKIELSDDAAIPVLSIYWKRGLKAKFSHSLS